MIDAARKPETNKHRSKTPALLPQDPTVCQTLPSNPNQPRSRTSTRNVRTNHRSVPPGTYLLIFHP